MAIRTKKTCHTALISRQAPTQIDAPTHAHSHSNKHMRMRRISTQLHCWIRPNMVGDISMATAGRRGADLSWVISRDSLLFDFWFKLFSISSFNSNHFFGTSINICRFWNTYNPASIIYRLPWKWNYDDCKKVALLLCFSINLRVSRLVRVCICTF